ncbi:unnamed protein product, partial [Darwinula stevensoni]
MKKGGNAIDAAVAVQFALAVVYPQAGNIGGGGFLVYRDSLGAVAALDFREKAPAASTETMYQDAEGTVISEKAQMGHLAGGVPGSVDGMWQAHQKYGKLPWKDLVQPAIDYATNGFRITKQEADNLIAEHNDFLKYSTSGSAFTQKKDWKVGNNLVQSELAATLTRIRDLGRDGFYAGETAQYIVEEMQRGKAIMTLKDLQDYASVWRKPIEFDYKNYHLISMPPPSSGGLLLQQMLTMVKPLPLASYGFHSSEAVHAMVEAERRAYADRAAHMGDPDFWNVPTIITDSTYLNERMRSFDKDKATKSAEMGAGNIVESEQTTHFSIIDPQGNAVSVTTTLNDSYGSRMVVRGAGFIFNNEMDDFSAKPGVPNIYGLVGSEANRIQPGKRMLSSMTPTIVLKDNKLHLVVGSPGGGTIPTSVYQVFLNVAEFGMALPEAVQSKRFHHQYLPDTIVIEKAALSPETVAKL